jgi:hypothetical protein
MKIIIHSVEKNAELRTVKAGGAYTDYWLTSEGLHDNVTKVLTGQRRWVNTSNKISDIYTNTNELLHRTTAHAQ